MKKLCGKWVGFCSGKLKKARKREIFLAVVLLLLAVSQAYGDFYATMRHGITFWTALAQGHPFQFYDYCKPGKIGNNYGNYLYNGTAECAYDFTIYAVFAIWNLPNWILEQLLRLNAEGHFLCLVWGKLLMLSAAILSAAVLKKIYVQIGGKAEQAGRVQLVYLSSVLLLYYTIASGNYDILAIVAILYGIYYYFEHRHYLFLLFFALAFSMKFFGFLIFVPLLLLREKRELFILRDILLCLSISIVEKLLFTSHKVGMITESAGGAFMGSVRGVSLGLSIKGFGLGTISLFFIVYAAIVIFCYMQEEEDTSLFRRKAIYICLVIWAVFFVSIPLNSYWVVFIVPFLTLILVSEKNNLKIRYLLESLFSISMLLKLQLAQYWINEGRTCLEMLQYQIFAKDKPWRQTFYGYSFGKILMWINEKIGIEVYLNSIVVVAVFAFIVVTCPWKKGDFLNKDVAVEQHMENKYISRRLVVNCFIGLIPIILYVLQMVFYRQLTSGISFRL